MLKLLLTFLTFLSLSCHSQNCQNLPSKFASYDQAAELIENSSYKINESVNTSKSSWIKNVHYYSCNGETGFFIIQVKNKIYIHANMPVEIWRQFQSASSLDRSTTITLGKIATFMNFYYGLIHVNSQLKTDLI